MRSSFRRWTAGLISLLLGTGGVISPSLAKPKRTPTRHEVALDYDQKFHQALVGAAMMAAPQATLAMLSSAVIMFTIVEDKVIAETRQSGATSLEDGLMGARDRLEIANAYDKAGCWEVSRKYLTDMFLIYVGSNYQSTRELARIQLDDHRSESARPEPANCPKT